MFGHMTLREQLVKERQKNAALQAQIEKAGSDIAYLAMMSNVEIEQEETEVQGYGEKEQI